LEQLNVLQFFTDTYETTEKRTEDGSNPNPNSRRGRPRHMRSYYIPSHPKHETHVRIVRENGHNTLPDFIGRSLPHRMDNGENNNYYFACMLMLLKPWRVITDLKSVNRNWEQAWDEFIGNASPQIRSVVDGIQYLYEYTPRNEAPDNQLQFTNNNSAEYDDDASDGPTIPSTSFSCDSEEMFVSLLQLQIPHADQIHACMAMELAKQARISHLMIPIGYLLVARMCS
jgi:hypothetical protein